MEVTVKKRSPVRGNFTKNFNILMNLLSEESPDDKKIKTTFANLKRIYSRLSDLDAEICTFLLEDPKTQDYEDEYGIIEEYNEKMVEAEVSVDSYLDNSSRSEVNKSVCSHVESKRKLKLPKIELLKFGGEVKDWLAFWSQFKRIHEDNNLDKEDKFQYLIQCMGENTRARDIIESFPPTSENYDKAIECLKSRFGRDELLIEFYVRELLKLVVKNATDVRKKLDTAVLYDKLETYLRALESIGLTSDKYSAMLFPLVESCIPEDIFRVWLRNPVITSNKDSENNVYSEKLKNLLLFLKAEVEGEERIRLARSGFSSKVITDKKENVTRHMLQPTANDLFSGAIENKREPKVCIFCEKSSHESKDCFQAQKFSLSQKQDAIKNKKCCFTCLKFGHRAKNCKINVKCALCSKKHLILMCPELPAHKVQNNSHESTQQPEQQRTSDVNLSSHCTSGEILLQTLIVNVKSGCKEKHVRVLIDSGSQHSYILERTTIELGIKPVANKTLIHSLFGGITTDEKEHHLYDISLKSLNGEFSFNLQALDQQVICGVIPRLKNGSWNRELREKKIWLTDFGESCPDIEVLIGADFCGQLFTGNMHKLKCGLVACETHLGWIIMGRVPGENSVNTLANVVTSLLIKNASIADLWKLDTLGIRDPVETRSKEECEQAAVEQFRKTVTTDEKGRYIVTLPWLEQQGTLDENKEIAERRCILTTQKLLKEGRFTEYDNVFKEWLAEGIIEEVPKNEMNNPCHYLPHRGVFKKNSTTTVRPVFDASCRAKNSSSLNDCLEKGPNLIEELLPILMRFRQNAFGVVSDIRKAFLQISIAKKDQDFLRFLWWEDYDKGKLKTYRHQRVVFGLTCSPFLLAATLNFHLSKNLSCFPETVNRLKNSFYVDNCVTSVSSEEALSQFIQEAKYILSAAKFDLRGWEHTTLEKVEDKVELTPVLGLSWDKNKDVLFCNIENINVKEEPVTRRTILSTVHSVFDPLGILCPVTLCLKLLVQESWTLKITWDEICPEDVCKKFAAWLEDLPLLSEIKIPRYIHSDGSLEGLSLHAFCDASKSAYSAVVFLRRECQDGIKVYLILAKSRVAPLTKITIPRLELLACCVGARLTSFVKREMNLKDIPSTHWTDSSTALYWIRNEENWGTFVNNRVKEIRNISPKESWKHIPGSYNPADLPSRGCSAKILLRSRWWKGPDWLRLSDGNWPISDITIKEEEVSRERRKGATVLMSALCPDGEWYLRKFSKYSKIVRLIAWTLRFVKNCRDSDKIKGPLTVPELDAAEIKLVKIVQQETFNKEVVESKLKTLSVFTDSNGLIRLKTKITRRNDAEDFKSPLVLPSDHRLVERLIFERHLSSSHAGVQFVLADIRQKFWLLRGRKTIQRVLSRCIRCKRYTAKKIDSISAPLPEDRVREALVFEVTGVDLAGPLHLRDGKKAWIVLFTCAVYRAIHLELIQSLSTDGFLLGFRRFIARRGRPKTVYSDNGTNFVGANNLMGSLDWDKIANDASVLRIQWKFNPPTAAWWGGWWERLIQMVKKLLRRVLGKASLHYEEMSTILCDVEATINSRPLNYLSEDPNDLTPLTPSMFIQETRTVGVPDLDNLDKVNVSKRYKFQQKLREELRKRFREEYLSMLIERPKRVKARQIELGDIVIVGHDNKKRLDWPLGKIIEMFPGKDGCIRVVKVKTVNGELMRPIQRLYPLELNKDDGIVMRDIDSIAPDKIQNYENNNCEKRTRCGRRVIKPSRYD